MIRLTINKLLPALVVLLLFASCEQEEFGQEDNRRGDGEKIRFEVAVEAITATPSAKETRVATSTDGNYTTTWTNGDAIGVYIVKGDVGLQSDNWVNNMKVTYNDGVWTPEFPSGKEYFPTDGEKLHFYAYYPYSLSISNATTYYYLPGLLTDQSNAAKLSASDMLYACTLNVSKGTPSVQLNFTHLLTMVELSVLSSDGAQMSDKVEVSLLGCKSDVSFKLSQGQANVYPTSSVKPIKMCRVEQPGDADYLTKYTYRALVPTQTVFEGAELFRVSYKQGTIMRTLTHTLTSNLPLYPGQVKPYTIALQPTIDPNHVYAVGDYYPYKGFPIQGIVYEVSNGGKNGKIVSLDEGSSIQWGLFPDIQTNATNHSDGLANMKTVFEHSDNSFAKYPAFSWVNAKNPAGTIYNSGAAKIWYLPALNELEGINNVRNIVNMGLTNIGVENLSDERYWSSSELSSTHVFALSLGANSYIGGYHKGYSFRLRAIMNF